MKRILFTPQFDGDEYHSFALHITVAGEHEVSDEWADYLTTTHANRFSPVALPEPVKTPAPKAEAKKPLAKKGAK